MKATKTCVAATRFQYDYLNDDINDFGQIDYTITNKIPQGLQQAIKENKKILVLINPPYAEAANPDNIATSEKAESKIGVSKTKIGKLMDTKGYAARELFVQFLVRISKEIPTATVAMFSTLKYVNAPNFELFRNEWNAKYLGGFVVHNRAFDGLNGNFPIGFLIWKTEHQNKKKNILTAITTDVLDKEAKPIGEKSFYNIPNELLLSNWIKRTKANNVDAVPLKNAVSPTTNTKDVRGTKWADGAIGSMISKGSDLQNAGTATALMSSGYCSAGAFFVTKENLWQAAIVFSVRRLIKTTWLNDRDQFLQPNIDLTTFEKLSNLDATQKQRIRDFKTDCLIWMLFNGSNLTASANDLEWNGKKWSIVNHFIPFTEEEVGAPDRFESDFMVRYLSSLPSVEGQGVGKPILGQDNLKKPIKP